MAKKRPKMIILCQDASEVLLVDDTHTYDDMIEYMKMRKELNEEKEM